ncbi:hypothetical protein [Oceanicella sp. SM1341]|uniref:hypothetical protein n=1 Tax=Oceanicella sp. SM1341 TaxID=1548889 RepID=UPI000E46F632|nr:hypothetical protein [Oceanicella sp. SM1341]
MKRNILASLAVAALLAGASVASAETLSLPVGEVFNKDFASAFASSGSLPLGGTQAVEMHGTPPEGMTDAQFAAMMSAPASYQPTRFAPAKPGPEAFRFVVGFGGQAPENYCGGEVDGGAADLVSVAVCNGPVTVSRASLRVSPEESLQPQVDTLMQALLTPDQTEMANPRH